MHVAAQQCCYSIIPSLDGGGGCATACAVMWRAAVQYALDYYPPFASGCGFILSRDLVQALLRQALPDYRLLVSYGIMHHAVQPAGACRVGA
jgi:hypothetical protein